MKLTEEEAIALAEAIYKAIDRNSFAREVADLMKEHGLATKKSLAAWVKSKADEG